MKTNPPSKAVKGLPEGTLRTTMTHLEIGDVILVMTATADPHDFVKAAPTVAPKRAFWATVNVIGTSGIVVVAEDGDRIIITDCAPQTAVTIRDREVAEPVADDEMVTVTVNLTPVNADGTEQATMFVPVNGTMVPGCTECVMPVLPGVQHACPPFVLAARAESATWQRLSRAERKTFVTVHSLSKHKSTRLNRRRKQVAA